MMDTDRQTEPKFRRRAADRPDEVLDAALDLFVEKGFAATRVEDIAERAGLSKGAVYLYFSSKQAIIEGLVLRAISPVTDDALKMLKEFKGDPRVLITRILTQLGQRLSSGKFLLVPKLIMREATSFPEIAQMYRERILDRVLPILEDLIGKGVSEGYFKPVDPQLTIRSIMGPLLAHILLAEIFDIEPDDGMAMDRLVENHLSILFDGLSLTKEIEK